MKKLLKISVFLLVLLSFTGCVSNVNSDIKENSKYHNLAEYYENDMSKPEYDVVNRYSSICTSSRACCFVMNSGICARSMWEGIISL